jgi:polysaccharide pyruvyl transferase WcaK-like protein
MLPYALYTLTLSARVRGTRIALVNVGADRANNPCSRWLVAQVARRADYLTLRDQHSAAALRSLHVEVVPNAVHPDLAFALAQPPDQTPRHRCVGVGLMCYFDWRGTLTQRETYEQTMVSLIEWLLEEGYAVRLLTGDIWDDYCLERVLQAVHSAHPGLGPDRFIGDPARDLHQLMQQMLDVEVVIGARYHNIVTALRLAKPVLALSYAPKATEVVEHFGLSSFTHRIDAIDMPTLKQQFRELYGRRAELEREMRTKLIDVEAELQAQEESFVADFFMRGADKQRSTRRPASA